jgi:hypothetical protein
MIVSTTGAWYSSNLSRTSVQFIFPDLTDLDGKTGLLTGLLTEKQGWKCPVALLATCCGSKSLKVILIDSDFRSYPVQRRGMEECSGSLVQTFPDL